MDGPTNGPTDGLMDRRSNEASYRSTSEWIKKVSCTIEKRIFSKKHWSFILESEFLKK